MARISRFVAVVAISAASTACGGVDRSTNDWEDPYCADPPHLTSPVVSNAFLGLFLEDGTPLCREDAVVALTQDLPPPNDDLAASLAYSTAYFARLTVDGAMHMFMGGDACNVYEPAPIENSWIRCNFPMQYTVNIPGCEPVSGTFTWNDNWFPWKNSSDATANRDWLIPVRVRCTGAPESPAPDASVP